MSDIISLKEMAPMIEETLASGGKVRLLACGNSMNPVIKDGVDTVVIKKSQQPIKKHDIVLYTRANGKIVLHRVTDVSKDYFIARGDSQWTEETVEKSKILGVLESVEREGKTFSTDSFYFKKYKIFLPAIRWKNRIINSIKLRLGAKNQ